MLATGLAVLLGGVASAEADEPDWKNLMSGVDGIVVYCQSTSREAYVETICDGLSKTIASRFEGTGLAVARNGIVYTGPAAKDGESSDQTPLKSAEGMGNPLRLRVNIKGTNDSHPAVYAGLRASLGFAAAVEEGSSLPGKAGDLVVAEYDVVANGPPSQLGGAIVNFLAGKMKPMFAGIRQSL